MAIMLTAIVDGKSAMVIAARADQRSATRPAIAFACVGLGDAADDVALDKLALLAGGLAQRSGGEAVEVTHGGSASFMEQIASSRCGFARYTSGGGPRKQG